MKRKLLVFANLLALGAFAQPINENFDNVAGLTTSGWAQQNLSTPVGTSPNWVQADATGPFGPQATTGYIAVNYNSVAGAATISNWLFAPNRTFQNGDIVTFYTRTVDAPAYPDRLEVRLSTNGASVNAGTTNTSVGDFTTVLLTVNPTLTTVGYPTTWTQYSITLSGLAGPTSGRIAFRYFVTNGGPSGSNSDYIGVDQFVYTPFGSSAPDVTPTAHGGQYTRIPITQVVPMALGSTVNNSGTANATNTVLTAKVFLAPNFTTPVQTTTSTATTINTGASQALTAGTFTPSAIGQYQIQYISSCTNNSSAANDTLRYNFSVTPRTYSRDDNTVSASFGIGAGPVGNLGVYYTINAATSLDSVLVAFQKPGTDATPGDGIGDSSRVHIYSVSGGVPTTLIGRSANYVFTAADTSVLTVKTWAVSNMSGGVLSLAPGQYWVGVTENNTNVGLAFTNTIFTTNTAYASWTGQAWTPLETFGAQFAKQPLVRPILGACTLTASSSSTSSNCGAATGSATATPTSGTAPYTFAWSNGGNTATINNIPAGTYTVTVTDASGCQGTTSAVVSNPNAPTATLGAFLDVDCNGNSTGELTASVTGGTAPYTYVWSNGANTATANGLAAGSYTVDVTDAASCTTSATFTVSEPAAISSSVAPLGTSCNGGNDGELNLTMNGGTPGFSFVWSNGATTEDITGLSAGTYTVAVIDANGCQYSTTGTVGEPAALSGSATSTPSSGADGTATATATGGTSPYTYLWSNGQTTAAATGLAPGAASVTITDANGCTTTATVTVGTVGLNELNSAESILVYPNPVSDVVNVTIQLNELVNVKLKLYGTNGQVVFNTTVPSVSTTTINTNNLESGVYFIELTDESGKSTTLRFVKQ